ncbi:hypothetical protein K7X08_021545 [Anisodus acutangulus]|uniref:Uncharacterized protein n=1 Tax=Anisodus acutangulus TaxID=402998 RepID=A0A9Q1REG8_9SOLA|nr:hypothetical protein K7X08_021545 [Anisodus acutangulus]
MASQKEYLLREFIAGLDAQDQKLFEKLRSEQSTNKHDSFLSNHPPIDTKENGDVKMVIDEKSLNPDRKIKDDEFDEKVHKEFLQWKRKKVYEEEK